LFVFRCFLLLSSYVSFFIYFGVSVRICFWRVGLGVQGAIWYMEYGIRLRIPLQSSEWCMSNMNQVHRQAIWLI